MKTANQQTKLNPAIDKNTPYQIVIPKDYTVEHKQHINEAKQFIESSADMACSSTSLSLRDTTLTGIWANDLAANLVGLPHGHAYTGTKCKDLPLAEIASRHQQLEEIDTNFINSKNPQQYLSVVHIYNWSTGLKARLHKNELFCHHPSQSILGIMTSGFDIEFSSVLNILPDYLSSFANTKSKVVGRRRHIGDGITLTDDEQIVSFLCLQNWSGKRTAEFLNEHISTKQFTPHMVRDLRDSVGRKLGIYPYHKKDLIAYLLKIGFHHVIPEAFLKTMIGSIVVNKD